MAVMLKPISMVPGSVFQEGKVDPQTKELIVNTLKCKDPANDSDLKERYNSFDFLKRITNNVELVLIVLGFVRMGAETDDVKNNFNDMLASELFQYLGTNDTRSNGLFQGDRQKLKSTVEAMLELFGMDKDDTRNVIVDLNACRKKLLWSSEHGAVIDTVADLIKSSFSTDLSAGFREAANDTIESSSKADKPREKKVALKDLLFTESVYNKSIKNKSPEEQFEYAKDIILHAYVCFTGVCRYVYLKDDVYGPYVQRLTGLPLDEIDWDKDFIRSLKSGTQWKSAVESLPLAAKDASDIGELIYTIENAGEYECPVAFDDGSEKTARLCANVDSAFKSFNKWIGDTLPYLYKIMIIQNEGEVVERVEELDRKNDEKRAKVNEDREKNKKLDEDLAKRWHDTRRLESGEKKSLSRTVTEANEAYTQLKQAGILAAMDNSEGTNTAAAVSENFVKLFIRYLERTYSNLDDCVKIYYYASEWDDKSEKPMSPGVYWINIRHLKHKSKGEDVIYFVINQLVSHDSEGDGVTYGHGNLTIVCDGKYKLFESVAGLEMDRAPGEKFFGKTKINVSGGTIQRDIQNCLNITLGYLESLMKQISKNRADWETKGKGVSKGFAEELYKYSTVTIPENITGVDKRPFKVLLPTKYIKYIQSRTGMDKLIRYAKSISKDDENFAILQEVAQELEMVIKKYDLSNESAISFMKDVLSEEDSSDMAKCNEIIERMGKPNITVRELIDFLNQRKLSPLGIMSIMDRQYKDQSVDDYAEKKLVDLVAENKKGLVTKQLQKNGVYKLFYPEEDPVDMTFGQLKEMYDFCRDFAKKIELLLNINDRAQMKRRTETLKIAALVDVLDKNGFDVEDEIGAVRDFN